MKELVSNVLFDRETGEAWLPIKYDEDGVATDWAPSGWTFEPVQQRQPWGLVNCPYNGFATLETAQRVVRLLIEPLYGKFEHSPIFRAPQNTLFPYLPAPAYEIQFTHEGKQKRFNAGLLADSLIRSGYSDVFRRLSEEKKLGD